MSNKNAGVAFKGTPEQEKELKEVILKHKDQKGALMPVLQEAHRSPDHHRRRP